MLVLNQLSGFGVNESVSSGAIQFVGGNTASKAGAFSGTSTIALNSGLTGGIDSAASSGDFVIAMFAVGSESDRTLEITDGTNPYTLIGSELYIADTNATNLRVGYKFITGDTSTTFGPTTFDTSAGAMGVYVFRGVNTSNPLDVTVTTATSANSDDANPPSITPSTAGSYIVCVGASAHASGVLTFTSSDLSNFRSVGGNDDIDVSLGFGMKSDWTSGAFDPAAFTLAAGSTFACSWAAMSIVLRPE